MIRIGIIRCRFCGHPRYDLGGIHSPYFTADGRLVDCIGREVKP